MTRSSGRLATTLFVLLLCVGGCQEKLQSRLEPGNEAPFTVESGFTPLGLSDFATMPPVDAHRENVVTWVGGHGGVIHCSGSPRGYLYTKKPYRNFTLRLEYGFPTPDDPAVRDKVNTGVLVYITGPHRIWPKCLEVQGKHIEMAHIKSNARDVMIEVVDDQAAREKARQPIGRWNRLEIVSKDGALTSWLNGTKICESKPGELVEGAIGLQAEDHAVEFRRIRIRED